MGTPLLATNLNVDGDLSPLAASMSNRAVNSSFRGIVVAVVVMVPGPWIWLGFRLVVFGVGGGRSVAPDV